MTVTTLAFSCLSFNALDADSIISEGNFETGNTGNWKLWQGKDKGRQFEIVQSPVRQGKRAAKFVVRNGDQHGSNFGGRLELSNLPPMDVPFKIWDKTSDEFYCAWSSYFPKDFPAVKKWAVLAQWHETSGGTGSVNPAVRISSDPRLVLTHNTTTTRSSKLFEILPEIEKGIWHDFILQAKWACKKEEMLELWRKIKNEKKYTEKVSRLQVQTAKFSPYCLPVHKKPGMYRSVSNTGTHTLYHDGFFQVKTF